MTTRNAQTGSYTRINLNSAHLIPTAAVWKAPKIILAFSIATVVGFGMTILGGATVALVKNSPAFNEKSRAFYENYDICMATTTAKGLEGFYDPAKHHDNCQKSARLAVIRGSQS